MSTKQNKIVYDIVAFIHLGSSAREQGSVVVGTLLLESFQT